jgi:hypothetical protein
MLMVRKAAFAAMFILVSVALFSSAASAQSNGPAPFGKPSTAAPAPAPEPIPIPPINSAPKLSGSFVYVYSFLDIREQLLGHDCLVRLNADLVDALKALGADSKVRSHKDVVGAPSYVATISAGYRGGSSSRGTVPIVETIFANATDERATQARYRLIVLPSTFSTRGAWQFWTIRWTLVDVGSGRIIWSTTTEGRRLIWINVEEGGEVRAKGIVDKFAAEFHNSGIHLGTN